MSSLSIPATQAPTITVIVAVLNGDSTLQRCLDSIACQSYSNIQLIVMDGGSTDRTIEILKRNGSCISYWESAKDKGIYDAWNKALDHATGEWICFLGVDDCFHDCNIIKKVAEKLPSLYPPFRVVYGRVEVLSGGHVTKTIGLPWAVAKTRFRTQMSVPHPGLMHHRSLFEMHGRFDESFQISGDYELLLRELKNRDAVFLDDITIVTMQSGGVSGKPENALTIARETRRAQRKHGYVWPGRQWMYAVIKAYVYQLFAFLAGKRQAAIITRHFQRWRQKSLRS